MKKRGVSLIVLSITVLVLTILITATLINLKDSDTIKKAEQIVDVTRFNELQYAAGDIVSDYQVLVEKDSYIDELSLREYVLERLKEEYGLTEEESAVIEVDEDGYLSRVKK